MTSTSQRTRSEDWTKRTWDLPTTLSALYGALGVANATRVAQRKALLHLRELPAWQACPRELQVAIEKRLYPRGAPRPVVPRHKRGLHIPVRALVEASRGGQWIKGAHGWFEGAVGSFSHFNADTNKLQGTYPTHKAANAAIGTLGPGQWETVKLGQTNPDDTSPAGLADMLAKGGGFSFNPAFGSEPPTTGYMVARAAGGALVPYGGPEDSQAVLEAVQGFVDAHYQDMALDRGLFMGAWHDSANHEVALELSIHVADRAEAVALGVAQNQQAIYDIAAGTTIDTGGTGRTVGWGAILQAAARAGRQGGAGSAPGGRGGAQGLGEEDDRDGAGSRDRGLVGLIEASRGGEYTKGAHGYFTGATAEGGEAPRPQFAHSQVTPVDYLAAGRSTYQSEHGMAVSHTDYSKITADPVKGEAVAAAYAAMPHDDPAAHDSYHALASEVATQYAYLTGPMGVKVDVVGHDPYATPEELVKDLSDNHHISVLSTETTGGHPILTNRENDEFRAVHDAFGHAATGRGFDRNGEEAAYQSHASMFTPAARAALATETRGQNSSLVYGATHTFPEQKVALLPADLIRAAVLAGLGDPDDDNNYAVTHCHHTSLGRTLAGKS